MKNHPFESLDVYEEAYQHTGQAIADYLDMQQFRGLAPSTVSRMSRVLQRIFLELQLFDERLGCERCFTLPEFLRPIYGEVQVRTLYSMLGADPAAAAALAVLRPFLRFFVDQPQLSSGVNLYDRWGRLLCPIRDGDLPRRPRRTVIPFSTDALPEIYAAILEWAARQRRKGSPLRCAVMLILAFEAGLTGRELRDLWLDDQCFDPAGGPSAILSPLALVSQRWGIDRREVGSFGLDSLRHYLQNCRPLLAEEASSGYVFPATGGGRLSAAAAAQGLRRLIDHLKAKRLLPAGFMLHDARRTYLELQVLQGKPLDPHTLARLMGHDASLVRSYYLRRDRGTAA